MKRILFKFLPTILFCLAASSVFAAPKPAWMGPTKSIPQMVNVRVPIPEMKQWVVRLGGPHEERVSAVAQTDDNGYVILGSTTSFNSKESDIWLVRLDSAGGIVWQKKFGWSKDEWTGPMIHTKDNAFLMAGTTTSLSNDSQRDVWIAKADENGALLWKKILFIGNAEVDIHQLLEGDNGDVIMVGSAWTEAGGIRAPLMVKIGPNGTASWGRTYTKASTPGITGISSDEMPHRVSLLPTSDGGHLLFSAVYVQDLDYGYGAGIRLVKLNGSGDVEWEKRYGGLKDDYAVGAMETQDQGYLILANTNSFGADIDDNHMMLLKIDFYGEVEWVKKLDSIPAPAPYQIEEAAHAAYPVFNGMMMFGHRGGGIFLSLVKPDASVQWDRNYGMPDYDLSPTAALKTKDSGWVMVATATPKAYNAGLIDDIVVIKVDGNGKVSPACDASNDFSFNASAPMPVTDAPAGNPFEVEMNWVTAPTPMSNAPLESLKDTLSDAVEICD